MFKPLQLVKIARAGWRLVKDPNRLDEVIAIADDLGNSPAFDDILRHIRTQPGGAEAVRDRPRIRVDLPRLRAMPAGSFGREVAAFMDARKLDPSALPHRPSPDDASWLRAHLYETHDIWHVATGFDTDVPGEVGLQAFYMAQFPARLAPILLAIVFTNTFLYKFDERDARMSELVRGWQLGKQAAPLLGVRWDQLWNVPLADVRARLGLADPVTRAQASVSPPADSSGSTLAA